MSETTDLHAGDVIQIDPRADEVFGGCLAIVDVVRPWGAQVGVLVPHADGLKVAYYRCLSHHLQRIGHAAWEPASFL